MRSIPHEVLASRPAVLLRVNENVEMKFSRCTATGAARAQNPAEFPRQTIRIIVPFAAGGAIDIVRARARAKGERRVRHQVVIENRPAPAGNIGMRRARAPRPTAIRC